MVYRPSEEKRYVIRNIEEIDRVLLMIEDGRHEKGLQFRDPELNKKYLEYLHSNPETAGGIKDALMEKRAGLEKRLNEL